MGVSRAKDSRSMRCWDEESQLEMRAAGEGARRPAYLRMNKHIQSNMLVASRFLTAEHKADEKQVGAEADRINRHVQSKSSARGVPFLTAKHEADEKQVGAEADRARQGRGARGRDARVCGRSIARRHKGENAGRGFRGVEMPASADDRLQGGTREKMQGEASEAAPPPPKTHTPRPPALEPMLKAGGPSPRAPERTRDVCSGRCRMAASTAGRRRSICSVLREGSRFS